MRARQPVRVTVVPKSFPEREVCILTGTVNSEAWCGDYSPAKCAQSRAV